MTIRVVIADDHAVVRQGLRFMLEQRPGLEVLDECENGQEAVESALRLLPDVMLIDLLMPVLDGICAIREIKRLAPSVRVIVLTSYHEDEQVFNAIKAGALSYLLKDSSPYDLVEAVRAAYRGECKLHPTVAAKLLGEIRGREGRKDRGHTPPRSLDDLTPREMEVLRAVAQGRSNPQIAAELSVSEPTVRTHIANILSKMHLADRTQAAIYALQQHLVGLDDALPQTDG
jgi:NarL family two-component system response regulator LiaR